MVRREQTTKDSAGSAKPTVEPKVATVVTPKKKPRKKNRRKQLETTIRRLRASTKPLIPLRVVHTLFKDIAPGKRIQKKALFALREALTNEAHGMFEAAVAIKDSSNKASLTVKHLQAARDVTMLLAGNGTGPRDEEPA